METLPHIKMKSNSNLLVFTLLLYIYYPISRIESRTVCVSQDSDCKGSELDCARSIPCFYGSCTDNGSCLCKQCWHGENCQIFVDKYQPKFYTKSKQITIYDNDKGIVFTAKAYDADLDVTCARNPEKCPCAQFSYSIVGNHEGLFKIDPVSGDMSISPGIPLIPGETYQLRVRATSNYQNASAERPAFDDMELLVVIRNSTSVEKEKRSPVIAALQQSNNSKIRRKRSAGSRPEDTFCALKQVRPHGNKVRIGSMADYRLEIVLPTGDVDTIIEVFTADPNSGKTTFLLCSPRLEPVESTKITSDKGDLKEIEPELVPNPDLGTIDRAIWKLGKLSNENTEDSDNKSSTIVFSFKAVLVQTENFESDKEYLITAGVEYNEGKQVWVGQSKLQAREGLDADQKYPTDFDITANQEEIYEDEAVVFTLNAKVTYPNEVMYLELFSSDDQMMDLYSVGNARLLSVGYNFPCFTDDPLGFPTEFLDSESEETKYRAILNISSIMNAGSNRIEVSEDDLVQFEFAIYALKGSLEKLQGNISFTAGFVIGGKTIWTGLVNISLTERRDQASAGDPEVFLVKPTEAIEIPENGTAIIEYKIVFKEGSFDDVKLVIEAPDSGELSLCQVSVSQRGFNIPYVPKFMYDKTEIEGNITTKMEIDLGRIQTTDQLKGNETANTLFLEVGVRNAKKADGLKIKFGIGSATVESPEIKTKDPPETNQVDVVMSDIMNTQDLVEDGETSLQIHITFQTSSPMSPFLLEVMGELDNNTAPARVCRVEVATVGPDLPCVNKTALTENAKYQKTKKENIYKDWGKIDFENVCPAIHGKQDHPMTKQMMVNFVAEVPRSASTEGVTEYWLSAGLKIGDDRVWSGAIRYEFKSYEDPDFQNVFPLLDIDKQTTEAVPIKQSTYVFFRVKLPPRTRAKYMLTLETTDDKLSVCGIRMLHVGHNMPCVDLLTYPGKETDITTTWINYELQDAPENGNKKAVIDFGPLSNVGTDPLLTNTLKDRNTLWLGVGIRVNENGNAGDEYTFKYTFIAGSNNTEAELSITAGDKAEAATESTMETEFKTLDGTLDVYKDATKMIYLDIFVPPKLVGKMVVEFKNKDENEDFSFCTGSITYIGLNLPCVNASLVEAVTEEKDTCSGKITLDLGDVCNSDTFPEKDANRLRIEVGLNVPPDSEFSNNMNIEASIKVDDLDPHVVALEALSPKTDDFVPNNDNVDKDTDWTEVVPISFADKPYDGPVSERFWIPFKITIPGNATERLIITAEGDAANDRAIITVWDIRVKWTGINIGCLRANYTLKPELKKSDSVKTAQNNTIVADFGYVTNTGFSYRRGDYKEGDNDAELEVFVRMTDHPDAETDSIFPVTITVEWGTNSSSLIENITVVRTGEEQAKLNYKVTIKDPKEIYQKGDQVTFDLIVFHENDSSLEPDLNRMRFFVPPYITYNIHNGPEKVTKVDVPYVELVFNDFIWEDTMEVTLTVDIDNNNFLPKGDDTVKATNIARYLCTVKVRGDYYAGRDKLSTCHAPVTITYEIQKPECTGEIGLGSGLIEDCQISASTAVSEDTAPWKGRRGGDTYWSPAYRVGLGNHEFQIAMGNKTMVTGIFIQQVDDKEPIQNYEVLYSDNGRNWKKAEEVSGAEYNDNEHYHKLSKSITCRYLMLKVKNDAPADENGKAIGAKFDFSGCTLSGEKKVADVCAGVKKPLITSETQSYRHFTVDEAHNIVYPCDYAPKKKALNCYCSPDGKKWTALPRTVASLVGYDTVKEVVYATDKKGKAFLKTENCENWSLATADDVSSADVKKSIPMPALPASDLGSQSLGDWTADFEGLKLSDELKLNWKNCCS